jgi:hypothetical protein
MGTGSPGFACAELVGGGGDTSAESPAPPPRTASQAESYIASAMNFAANILWIALGCGFLAFARSYRRSDNRVAAAVLSAIGVIALAAGMLL